MCTDSAHVANRDATSKEELVVGIDRSGRHQGLFPADKSRRDAEQMVCVIGTFDAVIDKVVFNRNVSNLDETRKAWQDKTMVPVKLKASRYSHIEVWFPDGNRSFVVYLQRGVRINIGVPFIKGDEGVAKIESAIDEALAVPAPDKAKVDA